MNFYHVDVFSDMPMSGNGLAVVFPDRELDDAVLLEITREFRQFETIFIYGENPDGAYPARVFTVEEELGFAGHPILGACAVIHKAFMPDSEEARIALDLSGRKVDAVSRRAEKAYVVTMNQGTPQFVGTADPARHRRIAESLRLAASDLDARYPIETVSTGLPYLLVPVRSGIAGCGIAMKNFEDFLSGFGAKFAYVFDTETLECRTWDNRGDVEDIATGSAAGPLCAYLVKNGFKAQGEIITLRQGRFAGRPSVIEGWVSHNPAGQEVCIRGKVSFFASGVITL